MAILESILGSVATPLVGGFLDLFKSKEKSKAPDPGQFYVPPPTAPNLPTYGSAPQFNAWLQSLNLPQQPGDPMQSQFAQGLSSQLNQNSMLPDSYRNAVLGQAQRSLGLERDRASESTAARMNKMNLLGSGAMGIAQGYIDESYLRGMANTNDNLVQQDLAERARMQQMLANIASQGTQQALSLYNTGVGVAENQQGRQYQSQLDALGQQNLNYNRSVDQANLSYDRELANRQAQYQAQQQLANQRYQSAMSDYNRSQGLSDSSTANFMQIPAAAMSGYNAYLTGRQQDDAAAQRKRMEDAYIQILSRENSGGGFNATQYNPGSIFGNIPGGSYYR